MMKVAREELENLERWKEQHRPGPIHLTPKKLGGIETEASARQKQQNNLKQSKYQQKFKRDDYRRKMKEEEEAEILKMKAIQREKANRLEAMQKQQKIQKEKEFEEDKHVGNNDFLSRLKSGSSFSGSYQNARVGKESTAWARSHAYQQAKKEEEERHLKQMKEAQHRKSELLKFKQKEEEEERKKSLQREHRRVNNAFLDRLQGKIQSRDQSEPLRNTNTAGSVSWLILHRRVTTGGLPQVLLLRTD
ncbi:epithelial-stromal interaction protein 1-like [Rhinatrema bivittatum]|uniref:epithelial-stromal interaction protein 1-like n=1 Tax=Rhinatrema bivittatum TaxID=194408 RepID=UPI0011281EE8|nr:epithelial-stromal interaction protein 1-like [Rhinatrema bivittatum]